MREHIELGVVLAIIMLLLTVCFSYASTLLGKTTNLASVTLIFGALGGAGLSFLNVEIAQFATWAPTLLIGVGVLLAVLAAVTAALYRSGAG